MNLEMRRLLSPVVILSALGLACLLMLVTLGWFGLSSPPSGSEPAFVPAYLTVIPAPTSTPLFTPTATPGLMSTTPTVPAGVIAVGVYVQISGTDGDGLRLRSTPGLTGEQLFLGGEAEVFLVRDGPTEANGYTWWYLVAPYDETRAGWAAANFLTVVPAPQ